MVVDTGLTEQTKEVQGVFEVVGEMWDETLMKSVGSSSLTSAHVSVAAAESS